MNLSGTFKYEQLKNIIGLISVLVFLGVVAQYVDIAALKVQIETAGIWAPLVLVVAKALTIIIAPLGGTPLYPISGALFGFWKGSMLLILGDMIGGIVAFYISRIFGRSLVERLLGSEQNMLTKLLELMSTIKGYLVARICLITFPELACFGAGLTRISFLPFLVIYTAIGAIPTFISAGLGAMLVENLATLVPVLVILGLVTTGLSVLFYSHYLKKSHLK